MAEGVPESAPLPSVATEGLPGEEFGQPLRFPPGAATVPWPLRSELKELPVAVQGMGRIDPWRVPPPQGEQGPTLLRYPLGVLQRGSPSGLTDIYNMLLALHPQWMMEQGWRWLEHLPAVVLKVSA